GRPGGRARRRPPRRHGRRPRGALPARLPRADERGGRGRVNRRAGILRSRLATVLLVDASPYIFRAHFSLPSSIKTPGGSPAAASYGFTSFLLKLIADEKPTHLAVCVV